MNATSQETTYRWQAVCKECQRKKAEGTFGYPDSWARKTLQRGGTRSNRCPKCRLEYGRDRALMAVPYIDVATIADVQDPQNPTGPLGGLGPLPTIHEREAVAPADLAKYDFGLKDDDVRQLLKELETKQVAVVVAGTGSGKSTFLPFRLLYPPDAEGRHLTDRGQIIITQPRRCAAIDIAAFVASLADPKVAEMLTGKQGDEHKQAIADLSRKGYFGVGSEIGYRVSKEPAFDPNCRLVYVTDGSLLNWIREGKLDQFGTIVIDEAHERSQVIDEILAHLKDSLPRHPRLRVIIVSATIDPDFFVNYYGGPEKVFKQEIPAKKAWGYGEPLWPISGENADEGVECLLSTERAADWDKPDPNGENLKELTRKYARLRLPKNTWKSCHAGLVSDKNKKTLKGWINGTAKRVADQIIRIVEGTDSGDILAFLPIERLIDDTKENVEKQLSELGAKDSGWKWKSQQTDVYKLLASVGKEEQDKARGEKTDPSRRRVILSTNIAETSLTIDGITFVVDSGLILQTTWEIETASQGFPTVFHSQDGVRQRWGRVGRKAPGWVFPLYTKEVYDALPPHTPPGSVRENAEQSVLRAVSCGVDDPLDFVFPAAFSVEGDTYAESAEKFGRELKRANDALKSRGLLDDGGDLTPLGLEIEQYIGSMSEATVIMLADQLACAIEATTALKLLQGGKGGKSGNALIGNVPKNNLFEFDWKKWDAGRRDHVRRFLLAMRAGCRDDLDLVLKVYAAWERAKDDASLGENPSERQLAWANKHFVSHEVLKNAEQGRKEALATLSFRTSSKLRPVLPELAPRVRAVFSYALPDLAYERLETGRFHRLNGSSDESEIVLDSLVVPPHTDRVIAFRRSSSGGDPALSNLVELVEWASPSGSNLAGRPWSGFVREAAKQLRDPDSGRVIGPSRSDHWELWDECPIGAYLRCQFRRDGDSTSMRRIKILDDLSDELAVTPPEAEADDEQDDSEGSDAKEIASLVSGVVDMTLETQYEEVGDAEAWETENTEAPAPADTTPGDADSRRVGFRSPSPTDAGASGDWVRVKSASDRELSNGIVQVVGYEGLGPERCVLLEPVLPPAEVDEHLSTVAAKGDVVQVKVSEVVRDWGPPYLACRETKTGIRVVLSHLDLTLNRLDQQFAAEMVPEGVEFEVTVTGFDNTRRLLLATRLPQVLREWGRIRQRAKQGQAKTVSARVAEVFAGWRGDTANIVVDGGEPETGLVFRFKRDLNRLVNDGAFTSPEEVCPNAQLLLRVVTTDDQTSLKLPDDPDGTNERADLEKFFRPIESIEWSEEKREAYSKRMAIPPNVRDKLLGLWKDDAKWRHKVWEWWAETNSLKLVVGSSSASARQSVHEDSAKRFKPGDVVLGVVNNLVPFGAFITLAPGVSGLLHKSEISWKRVDDPAAILNVGQSVEVQVKSIDSDGGKAKIALSMKSLQR